MVMKSFSSMGIKYEISHNNYKEDYELYLMKQALLPLQAKSGENNVFFLEIKLLKHSIKKMLYLTPTSQWPIS